MTKEKMLFIDWRDIQCGAVAWLTPEGQHYRVGTPPEPQVPMQAEPRLVPRGIRLQAQPARKAGKMEGYVGKMTPYTTFLHFSTSAAKTVEPPLRIA